MMKGLRFFVRCSDGSINIASYHHPDSLTWRWLVNVAGFGWLPRRVGISHFCGQWHIDLWFCRVAVSTQKPMWRKGLRP